MKVALFSTKPYDVASFTAASSSFAHELEFFEDRMRGRAAPLAEGFPAVCLFVNDTADARVLAKLAVQTVPGAAATISLPMGKDAVGALRVTLFDTGQRPLAEPGG